MQLLQLMIINFTSEEIGSERLSDLPKGIQLFLILSRIRTQTQIHVSYIPVLVNLWFISSVRNYLSGQCNKLIY